MTDFQNHDIVPMSLNEWMIKYNLKNISENDYNMFKSIYLTGYKTGIIEKND